MVEAGCGAKRIQDDSYRTQAHSPAAHSCSSPTVVLRLHDYFVQNHFLDASTHFDTARPAFLRKRNQGLAKRRLEGFSGCGRSSTSGLGPNGSRDESGRLRLRSALDQSVADQSYGSSLPRVIGAHAKPAVSPRNDRPGADVADLKSDRVLGSADPPHYANQ